jgi:hypothetical protein
MMEATSRYAPGPAAEMAAAVESRLTWSRWTRCESSFSLALAPHQPGLFALAEEVVPAGEAGARRLLAVFEIAAADDLAYALGRLFTAASPWREHLLSGRCFARFAVVAELAERDAACAALQAWLAQAADLPGDAPTASARSAPQNEAEAARPAVASADLPVPRAAAPAGKASTAVGPPASLPAGF